MSYGGSRLAPNDHASPNPQLPRGHLSTPQPPASLDPDPERSRGLGDPTVTEKTEMKDFRSIAAASIITCCLFLSSCSFIKDFKAEKSNNPGAVITGDTITYQIGGLEIDARGAYSSVVGIWFNVDIKNTGDTDYIIDLSASHVISSKNIKCFMSEEEKEREDIKAKLPTHIKKNSTVYLEPSWSQGTGSITGQEHRDLESPTLVLVFVDEKDPGKKVEFIFNFSHY